MIKIFIAVILAQYLDPIAGVIEAYAVEEPASQPFLYKLPKGKKIVSAEGETLRGYTLDEIKVILKIEKDYQFYSRQIVEYKKVVTKEKILTSNLRKQIDSLEKDKDVLIEDNKRLQDMWVKENEKRHLSENKPQFGSWLAWSVAGVATITSIVLIGVISSK